MERENQWHMSVICGRNRRFNSCPYIWPKTKQNIFQYRCRNHYEDEIPISAAQSFDIMHECSAETDKTSWAKQESKKNHRVF